MCCPFVHGRPPFRSVSTISLRPPFRVRVHRLFRGTAIFPGLPVLLELLVKARRENRCVICSLR
jgi:hypothetical protein